MKQSTGIRLILMVISAAAGLYLGGLCIQPAQASQSPYAEAVLADKPVGYWRFEESTGADVAANAVDQQAQGTYHNVKLAEPGASSVLGNAAMFPGADARGFIDLGLSKSLSIHGDLTIEWWQNAIAGGVEDQAIIGWTGPGQTASDGTPYEVVLRYDEAQKQQKFPRPQIVFSQNKDAQIGSRLTPHFDRWYHVAVVCSAETRTVQYYINGLPSGDPISYDLSKDDPAGDETTGLSIGRSGQPDQTYFRGYLDEVAIYDHTLTPDRILEHYRIALKGKNMAKPPIVVAHRGNNRFAPENTLISYRQAIEAHAPMVELDLQFSKDNTIILMHDRTLDRTTTGVGEVNSMTVEELKTLDAGSWKDARYIGEPVPTFAEVAEVCNGRTIMMLDLKTLVRGDQIDRVLKATGFPEDQVVVAPWQIEHAPAIKPYLPDATMILLHSELPEQYTGDESFFSEMKQLGFGGFSLNWTHLPESFVRAAQRHGMKVYTWTLNDPGDISGAVLMNVDGIITDDPAATAKYINEVAR